MATEKDLSFIAQRRHPEYKAKEDHWRFLELCYEGGREWFDDNIFKYMKEGDVEYASRVKRAYRFNHSREVVDLVNKYLFRASISRNWDDAPDAIKAFWRQSTPEGYDIDYLMAQISKRSSISGRIYVVVDNNAGPEIASRLDEKASGARTYAYWVSPIDVLDMSFDDLGELNWILIREKFRDDTDPFGSAKDIEQQFRLWTKDEWLLLRYKSNGEIGTQNATPTAVNSAIVGGEKKESGLYLHSSGTHGAGKVPVVIVDHMDDDDKYNAPALINDIAYLDRAVANYLSNLDAIIQDQTFSQLAMPAQGLMPGEEEATTQKLIEMGTKRIFLYNGESGGQPIFLSPDPRQAELIITAIRTIINEIYHTVGMAGERTKMDNSMGIDNSSGVAKAYDFERVNALLVNKSKTLQKAEKEILALVAAWNNVGDQLPGPEERPLSKWAESFDIRGLANEFEIAQSLALISAPPIMRREQMRSLGSKLFPVMSEKDRRAMELELDNDWPPEPTDFGLAEENGAGGNESDAEREDEDEGSERRSE